MTDADEFPELTDEFFQSEEFRRIQREVLAYGSKVSSLDAEYRIPQVDDEQLEAIKRISGTAEALASFDTLQRLVGRAVIDASMLEDAVTAMAIAFMVPENPLEYAEYLLDDWLAFVFLHAGCRPIAYAVCDAEHEACDELARRAFQEQRVVFWTQYSARGCRVGVVV